MTGGRARARYLRIRKPWSAPDRASFAMIRDRMASGAGVVIIVPDRLHLLPIPEHQQ